MVREKWEKGVLMTLCRIDREGEEKEKRCYRNQDKFIEEVERKRDR